MKKLKNALFTQSWDSVCETLHSALSMEQNVWWLPSVSWCGTWKVRNSSELWLASRYRIIMHSTNMARQCKFVQNTQLFTLSYSRTATEIVLRKLDVLI